MAYSVGRFLALIALVFSSGFQYAGASPRVVVQGVDCEAPIFTPSWTKALTAPEFIDSNAPRPNGLELKADYRVYNREISRVQSYLHSAQTHFNIPAIDDGYDFLRKLGVAITQLPEWAYAESAEDMFMWNGLRVDVIRFAEESASEAQLIYLTDNTERIAQYFSYFQYLLERLDDWRPEDEERYRRIFDEFEHLPEHEGRHWAETKAYLSSRLLYHAVFLESYPEIQPYMEFIRNLDVKPLAGDFDDAKEEVKKAIEEIDATLTYASDRELFFGWVLEEHWYSFSAYVAKAILTDNVAEVEDELMELTTLLEKTLGRGCGAAHLYELEFLLMLAAAKYEQPESRALPEMTVSEILQRYSLSRKPYLTMAVRKKLCSHLADRRNKDLQAECAALMKAQDAILGD